MKNQPREKLIEHLRAGRSVGVYVGNELRQVTKEADLPSEAELAQGDPQAEAEAKATLIRQRAEIDAQLATLEGEQTAAKRKPGRPPKGTSAATNTTGGGAVEGEETEDEDNADDETETP